MSAQNALSAAASRLPKHLASRHWQVASLSRARRLACAAGLSRRSRAIVTAAVPVEEAGILSVLGIAGVGLIATGSTAWILLHEEPLERKARLGPGTLKYLCEGGDTIVCSYVGKSTFFKTGLEDRIVQLVKDRKLEDGSNDESTWKAWRHRAVALRTLGYRAVKRQYLDGLQLLDVPVDDINKLDTELFFVRPAECREHRLSRAVVHDGLGLAVAVSDLFKAPASFRASPLLAFEFSPGCGLREVMDLPSRDALLLGRKATSVDPQDLFSGDKSKVASVLRGHLSGVLMGCPRVYSDGEPVFPSGLPGSSRTVSRTKAGDVQVKFPGCSLADAGQLVDAAAAVLSNHDCTVLAELQDLQQLAGGETEKTASALLASLREHGGEDRVAALKEEEVHVDAIRNAARLRSHGTARREYFEKEGRRLMSTTRWGESQLAAAQRWLGIFLLGRAAFEARLLVSFVSAPDADAKNVELRRAHFVPLKDLAPTLPNPDGLWVRVTILGLEDIVDPATVPAKATELEDAIRLYRESRGGTA